MSKTDLTPEEKFDLLKRAAFVNGEEELTEDLLDQIGLRYDQQSLKGPVWGVYFDEYGVLGRLGEEEWTVVHAEDGDEVTADLCKLSLDSALRRMSSYLDNL